MTRQSSSTKRRKPKTSAKKKRAKQSLQKPNGVISPRVKQVGGERFGIVCVDPAKHRSEWMMADYFGNLLIESRTVAAELTGTAFCPELSGCVVGSMARHERRPLNRSFLRATRSAPVGGSDQRTF